jgi:hypothetical protein
MSKVYDMLVDGVKQYLHIVYNTREIITENASKYNDIFYYIFYNNNIEIKYDYDQSKYTNSKKINITENDFKDDDTELYLIDNSCIYDTDIIITGSELYVFDKGDTLKDIINVAIDYVDDHNHI